MRLTGQRCGARTEHEAQRWTAPAPAPVPGSGSGSGSGWGSGCGSGGESGCGSGWGSGCGSGAGSGGSSGSGSGGSGVAGTTGSGATSTTAVVDGAVVDVVEVVEVVDVVEVVEVVEVVWGSVVVVRGVVEVGGRSDRRPTRRRRPTPSPGPRPTRRAGASRRRRRAARRRRRRPASARTTGGPAARCCEGRAPGRRLLIGCTRHRAELVGRHRHALGLQPVRGAGAQEEGHRGQRHGGEQLDRIGLPASLLDAAWRRSVRDAARRWPCRRRTSHRRRRPAAGRSAGPGATAGRHRWRRPAGRAAGTGAGGRGWG